MIDSQLPPDFRSIFGSFAREDTEKKLTEEQKAGKALLDLVNQFNKK